MRSVIKVAIMVIVIAVSVTLIGHAEEQKYSGFLIDYNDLTPGPKDGVKLRYIKPGVDFKKYKKLMLDDVVFFFAEDSKYKGIESTILTELAETYNLEAVKAFGDTFPLVAEPGPDVMRIRVAITKLDAANPGRSAISSVVPIGMAISLVKRGTTGGWTGAGRTGMEMEALDSLTNERIAAAVDEQIGDKASSFTKWGSAKEAFEIWSKKLRTWLDKVQQ